MSEQPAAVAREAKKIHQSLKELLKTKEPFDREVDFLRKSLRKGYLSLLLVHPNSNDSKDVENHLWMQTSYAFISSYKQRISALDRDIQRQQQLQQDHGQAHKQSNSHYNVVEHRRLIQRFKQFLADEERFWAQLVLRLLRLFDLHEARPALAMLGLLGELDDAVASTSANSDGAAVAQGVTQSTNGRNHFQFPPEDPSVVYLPATAEERETRLSTLSKALICLGDIARYREQYNESNGRPRAGHDDAIPARRGRRRGGGPEAVARPRNYDKAMQCYEQARSLVPNEGNPSHQLAILASYQNDSFSSIVHYYRSLCVRQPYDTAAENLGTVLAKALDAWRQKMKREKEKNGANDVAPAPRIRIDLFKEKIVVLHALWRIGMEKGTEKMKSIAPKHHENVAADFYSLVSERHLPIDMILNTIVLSQGALWKHRMIRDSPSSHHRKSELPPVPQGTATLIEWAILDHLLDLHLVLLEVGKEELKEPPSTDANGDLAQRITAIFRRTLPALRIASKWLRANFKYLEQDTEFIAFQEKQNNKGLTANKTDPKKISRYSIKSVNFWKAYAAFMLALSQAFPSQKLPPFDAPLEEDIEMRGFLPLRKLLGEERNPEDKKISDGKEPTREQVHPNVEQLMRITDLLDDAKFLVDMENSPLSLFNNHIVFKLGIVEDSLPLNAEKPQQTDIEPSGSHQLLADVRDTNLIPHPKFDLDEDDMTDAMSRTEDDPVRDAFLHLDAPDEQDDEVVYMRSPTLSPIFHPAPTTPVKTLRSPSNHSPRSPILQQPSKVSNLNFPVPPAPSSTTAQDLLNGIGGFNNSLRSVQPTLESSAPQPKFLFGSELSHRPIQSIWSAGHDEQPLMYGGNVHSGLTGLGGNQLPVMNGNVGIAGVPSHSDGLQSSDNPLAATGQIYQTSAHPFSTLPGSQDVSLSHQSLWAPYGGQTVGQSSGSFPHLHPHQHRRETSGTLYPVQPYTKQMVQIPDPFAFTSPLLQQPPVQRPDPQTSTMVSNQNPSFSYSGSLASGSHPIYAGSSPEYHSREAFIHGSRIATEQSYNLSPTATQTWGHGG